MTGSMRHKMCVSRGCASSGIRPMVIWESDPIFAMIRDCGLCGKKLPIFVLENVPGPAGSKRVNVEGDEREAKRPRGGSGDLPPNTPTGPRNPAGVGRGGYGGCGGRHGSVGGGPATIEPAEDFSNFGRTKEDEGRAVRKTFEEREHLWCVACNWSGHKTRDCKGDKIVVEELQAEFHWAQFNRPMHLSMLWQAPTTVHELMDQLTLYQSYLSELKRFFSKRDDLLSSLIGNEKFLKELHPVLGKGETAAGVYETLIMSANTATKSFVLLVVKIAYTVFKAFVLGNRKKEHGETARQLRARIALEVLRNPSAFPMIEGPLKIFVKNLEAVWSQYEARMNELESQYLAKHFPDKGLSMGQQRIARLPTSYLRLLVRREFEGKSLFMPLFQPVTVCSRREYMVEDRVDDLDDEYESGEQPVVGVTTENTTEGTAADLPNEPAQSPFVNVKKEEDIRVVVKVEE